MRRSSLLARSVAVAGALGSFVSQEAQLLGQASVTFTGWQLSTVLPALLVAAAATVGGLALLEFTGRVTGSGRTIARLGTVGALVAVYGLAAPPPARP